MKKILIVVVVLIVLGGGYVLMNGNKSGTMTPPASDSTMPATGTSGAEEKVVTTTTGTPGSLMEKGAAKEFTLDSSEFKFDIKTITVKSGDTVKLTLTNSGKMPHDWVVDEFTGAKTKKITNGQTDTITFVADKVGTYEYYCSVGQHRANGMVGKLIVQ